jgi:hypothetical protein
MGGSGDSGSGVPSLSLEELQARATANTKQAEYRQEVEEILQDALREFNNRDVEAIRRHVNILLDSLSQNLEEGSIRLLFGGSVAKHTYVNGLSDVDLLACLNGTGLEKLSPSEILNTFAAQIRQRLPRTDVTVGNMAVTVRFSDGHEIQVLPSIRTARGFRVADPETNNWSNVVSPRRFAQKLTTVNQALAGRVVPVIKLAKAINANLPKPQRLSGYHIESLAIEAFKNYSGNQTQQEMIRHFWQTAGEQVLRPIVDSTGQSRHVDDYLGTANSQARRRVQGAVERICSRIDQANQLHSADSWQELLET